LSGYNCSVMNRRDCFKTLGTAAASLLSSNVARGESTSTIHADIKRLELVHTWTTVMSSSNYRDTIHLSYSRGGITGHGEGAPIVRYHESAESAAKAITGVQSILEGGDPFEYEKLLRQVFAKVEGQYAARAAIDIAVMDWVGQKLGIPLYTLWGLDRNNTPLTTFSIGIDTPEITAQKTREAAEFPILKVKVGLATDEATINAVRSVTDKPLRVDANEGWRDKEEAVRKINWLASKGVQFIEQPMPAEMIDETAWVRQRVDMPVIADEACHVSGDIPKLKGVFDGINVKLDKTGGTLEALRSIHTARAMGMKVMIGCMVSSSCTVTAAAHLSPLVDYADLDGNLLIKNDPFIGVTVRQGKLVLPTGPGLGLQPRTA
jgi:L-Ala-D/L-Glu epimerase